MAICENGHYYNIEREGSCLLCARLASGMSSPKLGPERLAYPKTRTGQAQPKLAALGVRAEGGGGGSNYLGVAIPTSSVRPEQNEVWLLVSEFEELIEASIRANLHKPDRRELLFNWDERFLAQLPIMNSPLDQLRSDLNKLNSTWTIVKGTVALLKWLQSAIAITTVSDCKLLFEELSHQLTNSEMMVPSLGSSRRALTDIEVCASDADIIPTVRLAIQRKLARLGSALVTKFDTDMRLRVGIAVAELLSNVSRHSSDPESRCRVVAGIQKGISISVGDRGTGFDLENAILDTARSLQQGNRERGLLRLIRYGGELTQSFDAGWHTMTWRLHRMPHDFAGASIFDHFKTVFPIVYRFYRGIRIGQQICSEGCFENRARLNLSWQFWRSSTHHQVYANAFVDLLFESLRRSNPQVVGIAVLGMHSTIMGSWEGLVDHARRFIEAYLPRSRVVVFASSELETHKSLRRLAREAGWRFFEDERRCRAYLTGIEGELPS